MSNAQRSKSRKGLLLVLVAFILPVILAKLALEQQWFNYGVTNQGTLIEDDLTLEKIGLTTADFEKKWLMIYIVPTECSEQCEQALVSINNTYVALGKGMPRVTPVALTVSELSSAQLAKIHVNKWHTQTLPDLAKQIITSPQVLIVDPLGNIILSHAIPQQYQELPSFGKAILADFKKLLKYSRIG
jgi:hypothetical protein